MLNDICEVIKNANLQKYNTYNIKSTTKYLALPKSKDEIINLIKYLRKENIKYFILGNGSNVILPDEKFDGVVIVLKKYDNFEIKGEEIIAESGAMLPKVALDSINVGLKGLEWATAIPGTIGASIMGNAGAYLHEIMGYVENIEVLDNDLNVKLINKEDIDYGYRYTSLKEGNYIILSAKLKLMKGNKDESLALVKDRLQRRKASQPLGSFSAGSVFRNPSPENPSWKLIEGLGLKGLEQGGAMVSLKHANFIINNNNATSKDIKKLIEIIKNKVKEEYNIELKCEQEIIDWNLIK